VVSWDNQLSGSSLWVLLFAQPIQQLFFNAEGIDK
jgi:hypothetical protein